MTKPIRSVKARHYARECAECLIVHYWTEDSYHLEAAHAEFVRLAEVMGYEVKRLPETHEAAE